MLFEIFMLVAQLALIVTLVAFICWRLARDISGYYDSPFIVTPSRMLPTIAKALDIRPHDIVYDLGCGDGRILFYCARLHPDAQFIGVERNPLLIRFLRIRNKLSGLKNVTFREANLFDAKFADATRIYAYLLPSVINKLYATDRFPRGMRLTSRAFTINDKKAEEIVELSPKPGMWGEHLLHVYQF